jgi:hypothetical protein
MLIIDVKDDMRVGELIPPTEDGVNDGSISLT